MSSRKRKIRSRASDTLVSSNINQIATCETPVVDAALWIKAHEADINRGPQSHAIAATLSATPADGENHARGAQALIKWNGHITENPRERPAPPTADDSTGRSEVDAEVWLDRYDVLLLLDSLAASSSLSSNIRAVSPSGWSDLPSDAEDMFFFGPSEAEDYRREKRRRMNDKHREERLQALRANDPEEGALTEDIWGGSDEEPDASQTELMRRTANHLLSSPNPAQLEMRILANHGADRRFFFLRGRWPRAWQTVKDQVRIDKMREQGSARSEQENVILGGLEVYGDSDEESGFHLQDAKPAAKVQEDGAQDAAQALIKTAENESNEEKQQARRARAREWVANRLATRSSQG